MGEYLNIFFAGIAAIIVAITGLIAAGNRATKAVREQMEELRARNDDLLEQRDRERREHARHRARERMARDKAETVIYQLFGIVERGEPIDPGIRRNHEAYLALVANIDDGDSQEAGG